MEWNSTIVASGPTEWLTMTPASGTVVNPQVDGPYTVGVDIGVTPMGLPPGVYTGTITIRASRNYFGSIFEAIDSPQVVKVTYTVYANATPAVRVSTNSIDLTGVAGIGAASASSVTISNAGPGTLNWIASVQNIASSPWLSVSPLTGVNTGAVKLSANPGSLAPGNYSGAIAVTSPGGPTQVVNVSYTVRAPKPATLDVATVALTFTTSSGVSPAPKSLAISNSGELPVTWKTSATTLNGGQWLTVSPSSGTNNGSFTIAPDARSLQPGVYAGRVSIATDNPNLQSQIPVTLTVVRGTPALAGVGFYNTASLKPDAVVAGSLASVFGARLGPDAGVFSTLDPVSGTAPTNLIGTRVLIDGIPAPLFFVSAQQINLQIPYEAAGKKTAIARIEADGYDPAEFSITLVPVRIGLFTSDGTRAMAVNQDGQSNATERPAAPGSILTFFATGQGALTVPVPTGSAATSTDPIPMPISPVSFTIGGMTAKVIFSGLAPGTVGTLQLNVEIPNGIEPSDRTPVTAQSGNGDSNTVYISTSAKQE